jgi:hypothetical protein
MVGQAEAAEAKARTEIMLAAEAVLVRRGLQIADRLEALDRERETLRGSLVGLDRIWASKVLECRSRAP